MPKGLKGQSTEIALPLLSLPIFCLLGSRVGGICSRPVRVNAIYHHCIRFRAGVHDRERCILSVRDLRFCISHGVQVEDNRLFLRNDLYRQLPNGKLETVETLPYCLGSSREDMEYSRRKVVCLDLGEPR